MWPLITAGIMMGFASGFHCAGMCGPIALALPTNNLTQAKKCIAGLLYHAGRITTYATLGLVVSLLGRRFYIAGFQRTFSIVAGCIILLFALLHLLQRKAAPLPFTQKLFKGVQASIWYYWNKPYLLKHFLIGILNGLLPCGMVYFALVVAASFGSVLSGMFFMFVFGLGTLPVMLGVLFFGNRWLSLRSRNNMRKAVPVFIAFMGVVLVLRGLNLGIPFLSPFIGKAPEEVIHCHW